MAWKTPAATATTVMARQGIVRLRLTSPPTQVPRPKPQTHFRKSQFPYISYIFTGKLDLADMHLPDVYLPDVHPRRRIPRRRVFYICRRAPRTQARTSQAYKICAHNIHTHGVYAHEIHARKVHAHETPAYKTPVHHCFSGSLASTVGDLEVFPKTLLDLEIYTRP
jgi:hypothetical protein